MTAEVRYEAAGEMDTRIHRLAHSIGDLQDIVRVLKTKCGQKAMEQPIDTSATAGKCFLDILGVFAKFETNRRRERRQVVITAARTRPAGMDYTRVDGEACR
jgi:DNA invertase Pin-like site-specific DNA recombinase